MKNIKSFKGDKLILLFVIKAVVSTVVCVLLFSFIFSEIIYKFDLSLDTARIFSIFICALCSLVISFISVSGLKNNGLVMGILCQIPLVFFSIVNLIFNENSIVFFLIKLVIIVLTGALTGMLKVRKNKKFKV